MQNVGSTSCWIAGCFAGLKIWSLKVRASFVGEMRCRVRGDFLSCYECRFARSREEVVPMAYVDSLHTVCPPTSLSECKRFCCSGFMSTGNGNCLVLSVDNDDDSKIILHFDGTSAAFAGGMGYQARSARSEYIKIGGLEVSVSKFIVSSRMYDLLCHAIYSRLSMRCL